jgi:hypothetical protein
MRSQKQIPKPEFWTLGEGSSKVPLQWIKTKDLESGLENYS